MTDYGKWEERRLAINALFLDVRNPRIPRSEGEPSQRQLIEELVAHDNVYDLARDFALAGFDPLESLVGVEENDRVVIVEGNRRLAALKLLDNPQVAPHSHLNRLKQLVAKQAAPSVTKVRVLMAPSREDAAPLLLRKHTRDQVQRWSPLMQARFYRGLALSGVPLEELAKQHAVTPGEIREFLRMDTMYEIARSLDLPDSVRAKVSDPREFPASVLQRLLEMPAFQAFLRLRFEPDGSVSATAAPKDFRKAYARVISDIAAKRIDTRDLNTVKNAELEIAKWRPLAPPKQTRSFSTVDLIGSRPAVEPSQPTAARKPVVTHRARKGIVPAGLRCTVDDDRIVEIFRELKALRVPQFANAHAVMIRVLLELAVNHYVTTTGRIEPLLEWGKKKNKPPHWSPSLEQMLRQLVGDSTFKMKPLARKAVIALLNDNDRSPISIDTFNQFVHNSFQWPNEREIRRLWKVLEDVLEIVLAEPPPAAPAEPRS